MERQKGTSAIGSGPLCNRVSDAYSNVSAGQCADPVFVKTTVNCGGRRVGPGFAKWRLIPQRAAAGVSSPMDAHIIVNIVPKGMPETLSVLGDLVDGGDDGTGFTFEGHGSPVGRLLRMRFLDIRADKGWVRRRGREQASREIHEKIVVRRGNCNIVVGVSTAKSHK